MSNGLKACILSLLCTMNVFSAPVVTVSTVSDFDTLMNNAQEGNKLIVVDFFASWCGPCKTMAPTFELFGTQTNDTCVCIKINIDDVPELAQRYGVDRIPTFMYFKNNTLVYRTEGSCSLDFFLNTFNRLK